jgi:hypothetical protein
MRISTWAGLALIGVAVGLPGCGKNRPALEIDPDATTTLVVDNQSFPDMTIYVLEGGRRVRLGLANGNSETRFKLPKYLVRSSITTLRFQADPIGGNRSPVSEEINISPGDEVMLRIPPS